MRTTGAITNPSGYPYQWMRGSDYAPRDGYSTLYTTWGNPITMRVVSNREPTELARLILATSQRGMWTTGIFYPYDFSDRITYQRRSGERAPYGM